LKLREYQSEALEETRKRLLKGVNRQLAKWPTGMGKTVLFSCLPDTLNLDGRMLVLVHREELAEQAADKLRRWNPKRSVGVEMADRWADDEQLVVASVQTLGRTGNARIKRFNPHHFGAIVVDEAHHATAASYKNILQHFRVFEDKHRLLLGVTATPNRADGKGLGEVFEEIVHDISMLDGIRQGWLSDMRGIRIRTQSNLDDVHTVAGDFNLGELGSNVNTPARNELVVKGWLEHASDRPTVVFAVDVAHARQLAETFQSHSILADAIWGNDEQRAEKLRKHREGKLQVLVNCMILTEGYDDWRIRCIAMARPTKSESLYTQIIGRGSRIPDNIDNLVAAMQRGETPAKEDCLILDYVDNSSRHSLITLPTLFGLGEQMDLKGKSVVRVMKEIAELKAKKPGLDATKLTDASRMQAYSEEVDLFRSCWQPAIAVASEFEWYKADSTSYVLLLANRESVVITLDILEKWQIVGTCNGHNIRAKSGSLEEAIRLSDRRVRVLGGRSVTTVERKASWRDLPPTSDQLAFCRRVAIMVPPGATQGEVVAKMNEWSARIQAETEARLLAERKARFRTSRPA